MYSAAGMRRHGRPGLARPAKARLYLQSQALDLLHDHILYNLLLSPLSAFRCGVSRYAGIRFTDPLYGGVRKWHRDNILVIKVSS